MKQIVTKNILALALLSVFSLVSCDDKDKDATPGDRASCQVTRAEYMETGSSDKSISEIEYNAQGFISRLSEKEYNGTSLEGTFVTSYVYNGSNQVVRENYSEDGQEVGYSTYGYNADGTIKEKSQYDRLGSLELKETYTYDAAKRLMRSVTSYLGLDEKVDFEYIGSSKNIASRKFYYDEELYMSFTYENYDNKLNPVLAVKGIVTLGESPNNPGKQIERYDENGDGQLNETPYTTSYAYNYNASGYATEILAQDSDAGDGITIFTITGCK